MYYIWKVLIGLPLFRIPVPSYPSTPSLNIAYTLCNSHIYEVPHPAFLCSQFSFVYCLYSTVCYLFVISSKESKLHEEMNLVCFTYHCVPPPRTMLEIQTFLLTD